METSGVFLMCLLRMMLFMFPPVNWLMGASNLRTRDYVLGNMLGLAPIVLGVQIAVRRLKTVRSTSDLFRAETLGVMAAFLAVIVVIVLVRRRFFRSKESPAEK